MTTKFFGKFSGATSSDKIIEAESVKGTSYELDVETESDSLNEKFDVKTGIKRGLKDRHISLIALGGIIGPGILLGAGQTLYLGGPLSLILAVIIIGLLAFSIMLSLGEILSIYPTGGGFPTLSRRFHSDSLGAVAGYSYVIVWFCVLSNEYNTLSAIMRFWDTEEKVPIYGYILLFWGFFLAFQFLGVEAFGEAEYWLAWSKLVGLFIFYIFSIVYVSGGIKNRPAFGFRYWNDPGAMVDGFKGFISVLVYFSTFFSGVEGISATTNETKNPRVAIPRAVRQTTFRIIFVYFFIALFYGITVPSDDESLSRQSGTLKSPISIALVRAGWEGGPHLVNAFILLTCLSASNSSIYIGSRTITNLASEGLAPKFLGWKDKRGVPIPAIVTMNLLGLLSLMNISTGAAEAYAYIVNISGVAVFIVWATISFTHIRIRRAWKLQNFDLAQLPFKTRLFPYNAYIALFFNILFALIQGWSTFKPFVAKDWVDAYILIPFSAALYILIGFIKGFKVVNLSTADLQEGRREDLESKEPVEGKTVWYRGVLKGL
jgi:amino acid transporter